MSAPSAPPTREPSGTPGRYARSSSGLVASMVVVVLVIGAFIAIRGFSRGNQDVTVPTVAYDGLLQQARADGRLVAPAPEPMPAGWRATSVRYGAGQDPTWHLGVLTKADTYVGIEEARRPADALARKVLGAGTHQVARTTVGGTTWDSWAAGKRFALTRTIGPSTVLVGGPAGRASVVRLAEALDYGQTPTS